MRRKYYVRICYFGTYSREEGYPRSRVIIEGLRKNGVDVIESHGELKEIGVPVKMVHGGQDYFVKNFSADAIGKTVLHLIESL